MRLRIRERVLLLISLPLLVFGLLMAAGSAAWRSERSVQATMHGAGDALGAAMRLQIAVVRAESAARGYVIAGDPAERDISPAPPRCGRTCVPCGPSSPRRRLPGAT